MKSCDEENESERTKTSLLFKFKKKNDGTKSINDVGYMTLIFSDGFLKKSEFHWVQ